MQDKDKESKGLVPANGTMACPVCGASMKKVSWKITAGAFDVAKEVEQTVYQCLADKNYISVEVSTGNASEYAVGSFESDLEAYEL